MAQRNSVGGATHGRQTTVPAARGGDRAVSSLIKQRQKSRRIKTDD